MLARLNRVSHGYFQTLGTNVLLGRAIDEHDAPASRRVAVVTEEFVRRFLPNENPIGRRFGIGVERNAGDLEIVGVVANAKYNSHVRSYTDGISAFAAGETRQIPVLHRRVEFC